MKIVAKAFYNFVILALWLIFISQFFSQIVLTATSFAHGNINQSVGHVIIALAVAGISYFLSTIMIPIKDKNENKIR